MTSFLAGGWSLPGAVPFDGVPGFSAGGGRCSGAGVGCFDGLTTGFSFPGRLCWSDAGGGVGAAGFSLGATFCCGAVFGCSVGETDCFSLVLDSAPREARLAGTGVW